MKKEKRIKKDEKVLQAFIKIYCEQKHQKTGGVPKSNALCPACYDLLSYALKRNELCPLDPKPRCKKCHVHCYKPEMRERIKEVMKFSGQYYLRRGRVDWVYKYFF
ncbi:MAG: nitrous oxide-stimulated promoter family protein [Denitrovibrio sp.]|nr:MAG: nitrous oxide-stimulated promoter family protein [Denitrovibrio sp.]